MSLPYKKRQDIRKTQEYDQAPIDDVMPEPEGHEQNPVDVTPEPNARSARPHTRVRSARPHTRIGERWQGLLFEKHMETADINGDHLTIPWKTAEQYFPPHIEHLDTTKILISDAQNKDWPLSSLNYARDSTYWITNGWPKFVEAHNLEVKDMLLFFNPVKPSQEYEYHFLVKCIKAKETASSNVSQSAKQKYHGNEDDSKNKGGDHGGPSLTSLSYRASRGNVKSTVIPRRVIVKYFLFEEQLSHGDYESKKLTIPREMAEKHFPTDDGIQQIQFFDKYKKQWHTMKLVIPPQPGAHLEITGCEGFFVAHQLKVKDLIVFNKLVQSLPYQHQCRIDCLEYLFDKNLVASDGKRLRLPDKPAEEHFPAADSILRIFDARNKMWEMKFRVTEYRYIKWREFFLEQQLKDGDLIRFYKPDPLFQGNCYAIRFEKAQEGQVIVGSGEDGKEDKGHKGDQDDSKKKGGDHVGPSPTSLSYRASMGIVIGGNEKPTPPDHQKNQGKNSEDDSMKQGDHGGPISPPGSHKGTKATVLGRNKKPTPPVLDEKNKAKNIEDDGKKYGSKKQGGGHGELISPTSSYKEAKAVASGRNENELQQKKKRKGGGLNSTVSTKTDIVIVEIKGLN